MLDASLNSPQIHQREFATKSYLPRYDLDQTGGTVFLIYLAGILVFVSVKGRLPSPELGRQTCKIAKIKLPPDHSFGVVFEELWQMMRL